MLVEASSRARTAHITHQHRRQNNIVDSTELATPERPNSEARRTQRMTFLGGDVPLPAHQIGGLGSAVSPPSGVWAKPRRHGYLERFIRAAPDLDFADIKFISVKFSWGPSHTRPPVGVQSIAMSVSVCLSVRSLVSKITRPNFTKF